MMKNFAGQIYGRFSRNDGNFRMGELSVMGISGKYTTYGHKGNKKNGRNVELGRDRGGSLRASPNYWRAARGIRGT